ncbi:MAG: glycoside hydrolase family 13 protein [Anaerotignaceae bacterium]
MNLNKEQKLNKLAVFSDETPAYRYPAEPLWRDKVTVKIRTLKNDAQNITVVWDDGTLLAQKTDTDTQFDYYTAVFPPNTKTIRYYYKIVRGGEVYYYSRVGVSHQPQRYADFVLTRDFKTPLWSKGSIMYQIYVDRFFAGDSTNNVKTNEYIYLNEPVKFIEDWYKVPEADDVGNFYGGDLQGVMDKLNYLKNLGVDAIYFNPIFVSPSNHKYDIQDYDHIDPHIGKIVNDSGNLVDENENGNENATMYVKRTTDAKNLMASDEVFIELVRKAHSLGMKVILDGVFNHCGAFNKWLDREGIYSKDERYPKGAFIDENSPYREYFLWSKEGQWPENYEGWWGFSNHPKLNYENSPKLFNEIMAVAKKWLMPPFNADGWRIDVAADLGQSEEFNHRFWKEFRKAVKSAKPEAIILAEHYGDATNWLNGDEWDTIMNYDAFMEPVSYFLTGMEKHSDEFRADLLNNAIAFANTMVQNMARLPVQTLLTAMNQLSNHDHSRFLTRTNGRSGRVAQLGSNSAEENVNVCVMRLGVLIQMTWIGSPTIYYGDEAGLCGFTDPDNRRTYPWGREDMSLIEYHAALIRIRKNNPVLSFGSTLFLNEEYGIIVYGRFNGKEKMVIAINNTDQEHTIEIPVWRIDILDEENLYKTYQTNMFGFGYSGEKFIVKNGVLKITLTGRNGVVLSNEH